MYAEQDIQDDFPVLRLSRPRHRRIQGDRRGGTGRMVRHRTRASRPWLPSRAESPPIGRHHENRLGEIQGHRGDGRRILLPVPFSCGVPCRVEGGNAKRPVARLRQGNRHHPPQSRGRGERGRTPERHQRLQGGRAHGRAPLRSVGQGRIMLLRNSGPRTARRIRSPGSQGGNLAAPGRRPARFPACGSGAVLARHVQAVRPPRVRGEGRHGAGG